MNKIFDAHMHLNIQSENIIADFTKQVEFNGLIGANIILNSADEKRIFIEKHEEIIKSLESFVISVCFDWRTKTDDVLIETLKSKKYKMAIKLHPRLQNITLKDFEDIGKNINGTDIDVLVIDTFINGHLLQNHIGVELAIFLASEFPKKKIIVAHMGGHRALECVMLTKTLDNVYHDISYSINFFEDTSIAKDIRFICKKYNKRVLFGSDYPYYSVSDSLSCIKRCFDKVDLSESEKNNILYANAINVFSMRDRSRR